MTNDTNHQAPTDAELLAEWERVSRITDAGERRLACMRAVLAKWGALPVPAGYVLAPVEPTDAMVQAAHRLDLSYMPGHEGADRAAIYRSMLAAAPQTVVREPLTRQQLREAFHKATGCTLGGDIDLAERVCRVVEHAHGITTNGRKDGT